MLCIISAEPQVSYEEGCATVVHVAVLNRHRPMGIRLRLRQAIGRVPARTLLVYQWTNGVRPGTTLSAKPGIMDSY